MTARFRLRQAWTIARIEMRRAFFSKRGLWVYLLALMPLALFTGHAIEVRYRFASYQSRGLTVPAALDAFTAGMTASEVLARAGTPQEDETHTWRRRQRREEGGREIWESREIHSRRMLFFDGQRRAQLRFEDGILRTVHVSEILNFEEDRSIFAGMFQFFYLRLAIFFGCLGIFMNLFRGEMLDKTLHFWLLAPARREVLLLGKYAAGLTASLVIFTGGAMLAFAAMLWPHSPAAVHAYWQGPGLLHALRYALAAAMGCLGYGSIFLAAGLLLRNPIIPAAILLVWEGVSGFLPELLQKLSVLHYLQSVCPAPAPLDEGTPAILRLLLAPAPPASPWVAVPGLLVLTALVLWAAAGAVRRLEINYSSD